MVGPGLKKYAEELGFTQAQGVAYGVYNNYMLTLKEGSGWKGATFAAGFPDAESKAAIQALLFDPATQKDNRIVGVNITDAMVDLRFQDTVGTMDVLKNAVDTVSVRLAEAGVRGVECCNACHAGFDGVPGEEVLIDGNVFYMHSGCVDGLSGVMIENAEQVKKTGSLGAGIIGAILGAVIGAIPWGVASYFGWFVAFLGFIVGIASKKGYELLGGKETKAKPISVLISSLLAVVVIELIIYVLVYHDALLAEGYGTSIADSARFFFYVLAESSEVQGNVVLDLLLSWLFVILGIFPMLREAFAGAKSATATPIRLNRQ